MSDKDFLIQEEKSGVKNDAASLFVSLYLVILAFFILLNSISKIQEKRSEEAITSVRDTFSNVRNDSLIPIIKSITQSGGEIALKSYYAPIKKIAQEAVTLVDARIIEFGNTMQITIPTDSFFIEGEKFINPAQHGFMKNLSAELQKITGNEKIVVEFVINYDQAKDGKLEISRAGEFASALMELGVDQHSIFIGLSPKDDTKKFTLTFNAQIIQAPEQKEKIIDKKPAP